MREKFAWGTATASYQIEGAYNIDGKEENIWDHGCKTSGYIFENQTGNEACNHYYLYKEDIKLMKKLGVNSYRFSFSWSRIIPDGIGKVNEKGLQFYIDLVDELLKNDIEPYATLFHWDYPQYLFDMGGWMNDECVKWFEEYAILIAKTFKGKIKHYFTINEPQCIVDLGHRTAFHAPFQRMSIEDCMRITHNILKSNGVATRAIREYGDKDVKVGIALCASIYIPNNNSEDEINAAKKMMFSYSGKHFFQNIIFYDPIVFGKYPDELIKGLEVKMEINADDMKIIQCNPDYLGLNVYEGIYIKKTHDGKFESSYARPGSPKTLMGWNVSPECLYWGPKFIYERYNLPLIISENGVSLTEWKTSDGKIHDPLRTDFIEKYVEQMQKARTEGIPINGYFYWSLLDNFEWAFGYSRPFGLVYVDFQSFERIPKDSFYNYKKLISKYGE